MKRLFSCIIFLAVSGCFENSPVSVSTAERDTIVVINKDTVYIADTSANGFSFLGSIPSIPDSAMSEGLKLSWKGIKTDSTWTRFLFFDRGSTRKTGAEVWIPYESISIVKDKAISWSDTSVFIQDFAGVLRGARYKIALYKPDSVGRGTTSIWGL